MEQIDKTEENCRLDIAFAAIEVAGTSDRNFLVGEVLPQNRRAYLYAVPDAEAVDSKFSVSGLADALASADVPHAVDWDKRSENYGLRYIPDFVKVPTLLKTYQSSDAQAAWSTWKAREKDMSRVVCDIASSLMKNPTANLESPMITRISDKVSDMHDRRKPSATRRSSSSERS
jgi:hypothetical protein